MAFFILTPEDAGRVQPLRKAGAPLYVFDTWLGDDLVRAHPVFLATSRLKEALEVLPHPAGFHCGRVRVERSPFLRDHRPELRLPTFWVLEVYGRAGIHPVGLAEDRSLVVSQAALSVLAEHAIPHAQFAQYPPHRRPTASLAASDIRPG